MPFRDIAPVCPRCRVPLSRADDEREAWHCPRCEGTALGVGDLIDDLLAVAPQLRPADGVREVVTIARRASAELACPACGQLMEPVYLAAVEIERCRADNLVWLDRGERDAIVARADAQPGTSMLDHLRLILGPPPRREASTSIASRVMTIVSLLVVLAAVPLGLFGVFLMLLGDSSGSGNAAGGLSAVTTVGGAIVVAVAVIMFVVGGIVYVRAAGKEGGTR